MKQNAKQVTPAPKKPYETPKLERHGTLEANTGNGISEEG